MSVGTYSIEVWCEGRAVSGNPFSSEVYDISSVVVNTVNDYSVGEHVEFESKSCSLFNCSLVNYLLHTLL